MSRIACACTSDRPKAAIRPVRAVAGSAAARIQSDHRVEVLERDAQTVEDVETLLGLAQIENRSPRHDLDAMADEVLQDLLQT